MSAKSRRKLARARAKATVEMMSLKVDAIVATANKKKDRIFCLHCGSWVKPARVALAPDQKAIEVIRCVGCGRTATPEEMKPVGTQGQGERDSRLVIPGGAEKATSIILTDAPSRGAGPGGIHIAGGLPAGERLLLERLEGKH